MSMEADDGYKLVVTIMEFISSVNAHAHGRPVWITE